MREHQFEKWSRQPTQGACPRAFLDGSYHILAQLKGIVGHAEIFQPWYIDTICNNIPNHQMIRFVDPPTRCLLCHKALADRSSHYLHCEFVNDLTKGLARRIKRIWIPTQNPTIRLLSTQLNKILQLYKTFLATHYNVIPMKLQLSLIHRHCTNIAAQDSYLTPNSFPHAINLLRSCVQENNWDFKPFPSGTSSSLFWSYPSTTTIVLNASDIPPTCRNWSFYGCSDTKIPSLDKVQWYEHMQYQSFLFLFIITKASNEFCSLEREIIARCLNGCAATLFTTFPQPSTYHCHAKVSCSTKWSNKLEVWIWKFASTFEDLPFLSLKAPPIHRTLPQQNYWNSIQLYQPLFHEQRWIFAVNLENLPGSLSGSLQKWKNINQIAFLLGFIPTAILTSFECTTNILQTRKQIQKSSWRLLRAIYLRRRNAYTKLKKWITQQEQ